MIAVRVLSVVAVLVMVGVIAFGFVSGDFTAEGSQKWGLAWGKVTLVDLHVGLAVFGARVWAAFTSDDVRELLLGRDRITATLGGHETR